MIILEWAKGYKNLSVLIKIKKLMNFSRYIDNHVEYSVI